MGVMVIIDHKSLTLVMDEMVLSRTQTWSIWLGLCKSIYLKIRYQLGKSNIVVDAVSISRPRRQGDEEIN